MNPSILLGSLLLLTSICLAGPIAAQTAGSIEPIGPALSTADVARGEKIALVCKSCHSFDKGGGTGTGPNLWGIVGQKYAHQAGFAYSAALSARKSQQWNYEALNRFLYQPSAAIPGTAMTLYGVKPKQDRADLIGWLRTLSDSPVPLPGSEDHNKGDAKPKAPH